jgi:outer membrane lipoprotein carrier protein
MKRFILILALLLVLPAPALAMTAAELADNLQKSYDNTKDLKADFAQVSEVKAMNMKKEGRGTLIIKKPGLLRYTYTKPEKQELIVKGEELIMFTPSTNQVIRKKLEKAVMDKTPSTFLAGLGKITDSFRVRLPASGATDRKGRYALELIPKGERMGIEKITLLIEPGTYNILAFSFTEASGNTNTIRLSDQKINTGVKESAFDFQIPKGASVINQ